MAVGENRLLCQQSLFDVVLLVHEYCTCRGIDPLKLFSCGVPIGDLDPDELRIARSGDSSPNRCDLHVAVVQARCGRRQAERILTLGDLCLFGITFV